MKEAIKIRDLHKSFGRIKAVDGINFAVEQGEIFGFLGPNGAGKTTTARMITGVLEPDQGDIELAGYNLKDNFVEARLRIGVVPEAANAYQELTALENLKFMAKMYGLSGKDINNKAVELLTRLGLKERINDKVKGYSKGMTQRVILGMALINDPEILFLDEPTRGLDVQSTRIMHEIIQDLNHGGNTIFITTHNIQEANQLCNSIAIINKGKIAAIDSPENLKDTFKELQTVEICLEDMDYPDPENFQYISQAIKEGNKMKYYTDDPDRAVKELIGLIGNKKIVGLNILEPDLEDVFVELTGGELNNGS